MKYFLASTTLFAAALEAAYYFSEPISPALVTSSAIMVGGTALGTYVTYRINRYGDNREFIDRSVCLGLPITIRLLVAALLLYAAYIVVGLVWGGEAFDQFTEHTTWVDVAFYAALLAAFYWRLGHHLSGVSRST